MCCGYTFVLPRCLYYLGGCCNARPYGVSKPTAKASIVLFLGKLSKPSEVRDSQLQHHVELAFRSGLLESKESQPN